MIIKDKIIIDTARHKDSNGYMHVDKSNITKEQVAPYMGDSIPEWQELGLDPKKVYNIYRPAEELEKAVPTFNGLPLMLEHWDMDADTIGSVKEHVVGSLGTDANYEAPYLTNSITIIDAKAIEAVENGTFKELSAGYTCKLDMTGGIFDGQAYDGVMREIKGNHVALVPEGRAGHDVKVADSLPSKGGENVGAWEKLKNLLLEFITDKEVLNELMNTEEIKNEEVTTVEPVAENEMPKDETPVEEIGEEIKEAMRMAGLDPEDMSQQKAFIAGMSANKAEDACKDEEPAEEEAKDEEAPAEKVGDSAEDMKKHFASLWEASEAVAPFIGKVNNPMAFDSAADIYKKALVNAGINLEGIEPIAYKAMFKTMTAMQKPQAMANDVKDNDPINAKLMGIKSY
jgi:hypothetical protein